MKKLKNIILVLSIIMSLPLLAQEQNQVYFQGFQKELSGKRFIYHSPLPNVTASFKLIDDVFILVAGATGDLVQNTYQN